MQRLEFRAMGCAMSVALDADAPATAKKLRRVPHWFAAWELCLSRFRADSELSALNRAAGRTVRVSAELFQVVRLALRAAAWTDGLVTPTLLRALEAAGYDRSFEALDLGAALPSPVGADVPAPSPERVHAADWGGRTASHHSPALLEQRSVDGSGPAFLPAGDNLAGQLRKSLPYEPDYRTGAPTRSPAPGPQPPTPNRHAWRSIHCDERRLTITLPCDVALDLGGIAKGWAADRAARRLARYAPALVDAGGDIAASGPMADGQPWLIGVADPRAPDGDLELVRLRRGGIATSGRDYRRWQRDGVWQHHIIDPRTGRPAVTDVLSATVIAPSAYQAEAAAKVAFLLGSRDALAWLDALPGFAGLLVLEDGWVARSRRLEDYVWR